MTYEKLLAKLKQRIKDNPHLGVAELIQEVLPEDIENLFEILVDEPSLITDGMVSAAEESISKALLKDILHS